MNTRGLCNRRRKGDILNMDKRKSLTIDCYRAADWVAPDGKPFCRLRLNRVVRSKMNMRHFTFAVISLSVASSGFAQSPKVIKVKQFTGIYPASASLQVPFHGCVVLEAQLPPGVLVNRDSVRRSLGCLKGQDAGLPSDLTLAWRGTTHQEGGTTFFGSKISWRGRTATTALNDWADMRIVRPRVAA